MQKRYTTQVTFLNKNDPCGYNERVLVMYMLEAAELKSLKSAVSCYPLSNVIFAVIHSFKQQDGLAVHGLREEIHSHSSYWTKGSSSHTV